MHDGDDQLTATVLPNLCMYEQHPLLQVDTGAFGF